ncbi:MAG TPA: DUF664 domain-containing protein [Acidimicrobiales bacterium]|nr:DUF664 domain-containing protein [Acidimicrobiales bacterium]
MPVPSGRSDEKELLLEWLGYLRAAVVRKLQGLDDVQARWQPEGRLISLIGVVNHLTCVERRWIDGGFCGATVFRSEDEFKPGPELSVESAISLYEQRAQETNRVVRCVPLAQPSPRDSWAEGHDLRFVLLHMINETARHAGHADSTRELLDGSRGE